MKIIITADDSNTLVLNKLTNVEDLTKLTDSETGICLLASPPKEEECVFLQEQGFRVLTLSQLLAHSLIPAPPKFSDIFEREEHTVDTAVLEHFYKDQTVLVTGGEGFIGSEIVDCLLRLPVKKIIAYGHGENAAHDLINKYKDDSRFCFVLGDIRDEGKLDHVFCQFCPDTVFHAAAHKHVPILSQFPEEAVKTNILGTRKTADAAVNHKVKNFVLVSTDKAVNSTSALGASKRIAEKICLSMNTFCSDTIFSVVRFGNVFGSTGSVVPTFVEQLAYGKPLTVTDKNMLRYFMSVREAVNLVMLAGTMQKRLLFSLDMGTPVTIEYLIKKLLNHIGKNSDEHEITIIGNRGGEKFAEELIHPFDQPQQSPYDKLLILHDESSLWSESELNTVCGQFAHTAAYGSKEEVLKLFEKNITRYTEV